MGNRPRIKTTASDVTLYSPRVLARQYIKGEPVTNVSVSDNAGIVSETALFQNFVQNKIMHSDNFPHVSQHVQAWQDHAEQTCVEPKPFVLKTKNVNGTEIDCPKDDVSSITVTQRSYASNCDMMRALKAIEKTLADQDVSTPFEDADSKAYRTFHQGKPDVLLRYLTIPKKTQQPRNHDTSIKY